VWEEHRAGRPRLDHIDSKILSVFQENEYQSVRTLAQELNVSLSTVHARSTDVFGFSLRHTRRVPRLLTDELKSTRVATSVKMLEILEQQNGEILQELSGEISRGFFSSTPEIVSGD
jgi:AraC-like DNA-binding protein